MWLLPKYPSELKEEEGPFLKVLLVRVLRLAGRELLLPVNKEMMVENP